MFVLLVGGCVAALASVNDPRSGLASDGDYRLTISSCEVVDGIPMGSGTIRSTNPELESFRVQMWAYDNETRTTTTRCLQHAWQSFFLNHHLRFR